MCVCLLLLFNYFISDQRVQACPAISSLLRAVHVCLRAIFFLLERGGLHSGCRWDTSQHTRSSSTHLHMQQQSPSRMQAAGTPKLTKDTRSTPQATAPLSARYSQHHHTR